MTEQPDLPPPTSVESLVAALLEAGPEVAEHVVRAAQELLAAAQVVVDAADKAIREQQELRTQPGDAGEHASDEDAPDAAVSPLRRLDVAE
jgi:ABC-type nitrate/sulfonate/bicarbonate transport system substrate-binding protein